LFSIVLTPYPLKGEQLKNNKLKVPFRGFRGIKKLFGVNSTDDSSGKYQEPTACINSS
jgi:hypothetical protein